MGTYVHGDKTRGEDHSVCIVEYEGNRMAIAENSWAKPGGVDDRCEIYGSKGHTRADLLRGSALITYSDAGYGYAVEKAPTTKGWTYPVYEELWSYGFPQEMRHFARCVRGTEQLAASGEDGRLVMEVLYAGYASAGAGRKVELPFRPSGVSRPVDLRLGKDKCKATS
jgi:predicted dehydrogenase